MSDIKSQKLNHCAQSNMKPQMSICDPSAQNQSQVAFLTF